MALSLQQQLAHIKNQLERVEDLLKEQQEEKEAEGKKQLVFHITFEYKTTADAWPEDLPPTQEAVSSQIMDNLERVTEELQFDCRDETFSLVGVHRILNPQS